MAAEPHWPDFGELHHFAGSAPSLQQPTLQRLAAALGAPELLAAVAAVTGHLVRRVEARSYVYVPGSYLLPHTDCNPERAVSFALYLSPRQGCEGGELELFGATTEEGEIVATAPAVTIEPLPGRLVLLDVSPLSLHQVREVLAGHRASIAGWLLR